MIGFLTNKSHHADGDFLGDESSTNNCKEKTSYFVIPFKFFTALQISTRIWNIFLTRIPIPGQYISSYKLYERKYSIKPQEPYSKVYCKCLYKAKYNNFVVPLPGQSRKQIRPDNSNRHTEPDPQHGIKYKLTLQMDPDPQHLMTYDLFMKGA